MTRFNLKTCISVMIIIGVVTLSLGLSSCYSNSNPEPSTGPGWDLLLHSSLSLDTGTYPRSVAIGDLDGDGSPDLVAANSGSDSVSVLPGNGHNEM